MKKQLIVSIGREFGSGGHVIAEALAGKLEIKIYDNELIEEVSKSSGYNKEVVKKHDERPNNTFLSSTIRGYTNSIDENVALKQFDFLRKRAEEGESFVVVGRCSDFVLKDATGIIKIFILADLDDKAKRTAELFHISKDEAMHMNQKVDKIRKSYHNYYSDSKWGDSRSYDITINSSKLGIEKTIKVLHEYINEHNG